MQQLVQQLREISADRADHIFKNGKLVHSALRRSLLLLGSEGYHGRNSGSANLWLLIKLLGRQPQLRGHEWPAAELVFPRTRLLGKGSFSKVYECKDYALKCLNTKGNWDREVALLQALVHPNLVKLADWWLCSGQQVLLLEKAPGIELRSYYGKCSAGELPTLGSQLFSAVAYIHGQGYVHRDIKPCNLMWDPKSAKLTILDLGVAKKTELVVSWSGSLAFTVPEVYRRRNRPTRQLLEANDVWACVASLWSLVKGHSPFHGIKQLDELRELFIREDKEILAMMKWECHHSWLQQRLVALANQASAQKTWEDWLEFIFPQSSVRKTDAVPLQHSAQEVLDQR
jgi:serine/threonine protein kinase